jgi:RHS repeat-associated protein
LGRRFLRPLSVGTTSGSITRDYIFLGGKRIAFVSLSSGNPYYYLSDHLGSTAVIAGGDGKTIQWEADYFSFGAVRQVFTSIVGNNYEFTGYENDSETGYNYAVERFDAGRWGRFLTPDPYLGSMDIGNPQSMNRYAYVMNNPLNFIDPLGLDCIADGELDGSIGNSIECDSAGGVWDDSTPDGQAVGTTVTADWSDLPDNGNLSGSVLPSPNSGNQGGAPGIPSPTLLRLGLPPGFGLQYCGPGGRGTPSDGVDRICMQHDRCYQDAGLSFVDSLKPRLSAAKQQAKAACDRQLCSGIANNMAETRSENAEAFFVGAAFGCIP